MLDHPPKLRCQCEYSGLAAEFALSIRGATTSALGQTATPIRLPRGRSGRTIALGRLNIAHPPKTSALHRPPLTLTLPHSFALDKPGTAAEGLSGCTSRLPSGTTRKVTAFSTRAFAGKCFNGSRLDPELFGRADRGDRRFRRRLPGCRCLRALDAWSFRHRARLADTGLAATTDARAPRACYHHDPHDRRHVGVRFTHRLGLWPRWSLDHRGRGPLSGDLR